MAIIKCKMCGGDLKVEAEETVAECEYCGTKQTVPTADDEKKLSLFGRAGRLLRGCEFDKAYGVFESIVAEFPEEAEAYWGLVLCKYGIEYVDDPATGKKIPTCHRSSFDSVMDDENFAQACENASLIAKRVYRDEAKAIEELRKGIIDVSGKEDPYDIFICYKETDEVGQRTLDSVLAQDVYDALTEKGYRVFFARITLEDKLGQEYEPYIFAALHSSKIMLAIGTAFEYYDAVWVKNEWSRFLALIAAGEKKTLIPCYKGLDAYDMPKEFAKLQAQDMGKVGAMQDLLRGIEKILPRKVESHAATAAAAPANDTAPLLKRAFMFLEDGEWASADEYCEKVLDIDPENAEAYLGKFLAFNRVTALANLEHKICSLESKEFRRAEQFADPDLATKLNSIKDGYARKIAGLKLIDVISQFAAKKAEEERLAEDLRARNEAIPQLREKREYLRKVNGLIAAGSSYTVGLRTDGTVVADGDFIQRSVFDWKGISAITTGESYAVGLRSDGTVVAINGFGENQNKVSDWTDIIATAAGGDHIVGLRSDGTVVATEFQNKRFYYGQCDVSDWKDIVAIAAGRNHTVGLRSDGTVVAVGENHNGQCDVSDWKDIVAIAAGRNHTVGLRSDGTVVALGYACLTTSDWRDIVAIAMVFEHTVGLRADGTVVAMGKNTSGQCDVSDWKDIVAIAAGEKHTVGLRSDGTVVVAGKIDANDGRCNVSGWKLFNSIDTVEQERDEVKERCIAEEKAAEEQRIAAEKAETERKASEVERKAAEAARIAKERAEKKAKLEAERSQLQTELANLKGLFTGKRRMEIEWYLDEIEKKLKTLG